MSDAPPPDPNWYQADDGKWHPKSTSPSKATRRTIVGLGVLVLALAGLVGALVLRAGGRDEVQTAVTAASSTPTTRPDPTTTTTMAPTTSTTAVIFEAEPVPIGPSPAVAEWADQYSQFRAELASMRPPAGGTLEQEQQSCTQQRDGFARWAAVLLPAPDPVLSGDFTELVSAGQRVASICIEAPWIFETDRSWIDRRDAAHTRIVDQIYLLGATYTGPLS